MTTSPILDLSYRNYDGPIEPPLMRWKPIARVGIMKAFKNKWFWVLTILSGLWYAVLMTMFYFLDTFASSIPQAGRGPQGFADPTAASAAILKQVNWSEPFLHGFSMGQLFFFIISLLLAVGAIANDNRANALLVYLSKPCTKWDYVFGKWLGIFVPMAVACAIPTAFFYAYCFMSYREFGFLTHDYLLVFKLMLLVLIPAAVHASLGLAVSSLFKQGRIAGATYAALYFFSLFFTKAMQILHFQLGRNEGSLGLVDNLFYFSIDGIQIGLAKAILGVDGNNIVPVAPIRGNAVRFVVGAPNGMLFGFIVIAVCVGAVVFAWSRIRAVEVVGG